MTIELTKFQVKWEGLSFLSRLAIKGFFFFFFNQIKDIGIFCRCQNARCQCDYIKQNNNNSNKMFPQKKTCNVVRARERLLETHILLLLANMTCSFRTQCPYSLPLNMRLNTVSYLLTWELPKVTAMLALRKQGKMQVQLVLGLFQCCYYLD
jgi:hypothetical protein